MIKTKLTPLTRFRNAVRRVSRTLSAVKAIRERSNGERAASKDSEQRISLTEYLDVDGLDISSEPKASGEFPGTFSTDDGCKNSSAFEDNNASSWGGGGGVGGSSSCSSSVVLTGNGGGVVMTSAASQVKFADCAADSEKVKEGSESGAESKGGASGVHHTVEPGMK